MSVYAPATKAIAQRPLHELLHARRRIDECATTRINLLACQNIVAACEERMRIEAQLMQRRHGWLL